MFERVLVTGDQGFVGRHALHQWPTAIGLSALKADADIRNPAKAKAKLGWEAKTHLETLITMMMSADLARVSKE